MYDPDRATPASSATMQAVDHGTQRRPGARKYPVGPAVQRVTALSWEPDRNALDH